VASEVQELAREKATDWLELASEYAERMLPQIFRGTGKRLEDRDALSGHSLWCRRRSTSTRNWSLTSRIRREHPAICPTLRIGVS
jgi:hypothetical protein